MSKFKLPDKIDNFLSILAKRYHSKSWIYALVNSQPEVIEGIRYDNWNEGIDFHEVILHIPQDIYLEIMDSKNKIEKQILSDLQTLSESVSNEGFDAVRFEPSDSGYNPEWREQTGMLVHNAEIKKAISRKNLEKIWGNNPDFLKVFISHRDKDKKLAKSVAEELKKFKIYCFVAHDTIKPLENWMPTIENGLYSMDLFMALITDEFHNSSWTNQEIGFAIGSSTPIISIRTKSSPGKYCDPQGFYGKFQGMTFDQTVSFPSFEFIKIILESDRIPIMLKEKMKDILILCLYELSDWETGASVAQKLFPCFEKVTLAQAQKLVDAYNSNKTLRTCKAISGYDCHGNFYVSPKQISEWLYEWTGNKYELTQAHLCIKGKVKSQDPF